LYRRYRPETFAEVIGQDHVTAPLRNALSNNRVNHAYLFSGPRGCGKTTSARILARAINCEKGPIAEPCGVCKSCTDLARGGPGSIDVIEIDAASHGGVDDARDLRERAFFAPVESRYKIYIIDEAHMVTTQGFNALLKLVEEPPPHVKFIFATTEPEKVIGTIKSRTHHYPFRLVAPKILGDYVVTLCERDGITIEPTAVPLIVRAGGGSVRDSLSVLDQLMGGSGPDGVTYSLTTALLGYTPGSLLDETVDALAADDGATLFGVIEKIIETGQDPRRFAEDLLHRLRDLVVVSAVPDAAARGIIEVPEDQAERFAGQAARFGRAELTRAADIVSQGLTDMRGATAPRLLLEIMLARILLPGLDHTAEGFGARIDRVERRLSVVGDPSTSTSRPPAATPEVTTATAVPPPSSTSSATGPAATGGTAKDPAPSGSTSSAGSGSAEDPVGPPQTPGAQPATRNAQTAAAPRDADPAAPREAASGLTLVDARRLWPGVLERVKTMRRFSWLLLSQNAQVKDLHDGIITIGFASTGAAKNFRTSGADEILHQALIDELGVDWRVEGVIDGPGETGGGRAPAPLADTTSTPTRPADRSDAAAAPSHRAAADSPGAAAEGATAPVDVPVATQRSAATAPSAEAPPDSTNPAPRPSELAPFESTPSESDHPESNDPSGSEAPVETPSRRAQPDIGAAKRAIRPTRVGAAKSERADERVEVSDDDVIVDDGSLSSHELLARELGAQVIEDVHDDVS
jgi:DNA polymerase-3 subunit gamma/tau